MYKHAALSPAIQALQQNSPAGAQGPIFEQKFGELAYQTFSAKFPDLVESIVTFKVLDSDTDAGTALGAFILSLDGETLYVPAVFADNEIFPLDILYVKSKNVFVPFTPEWVEETRRGSMSVLGAGEKMPSTVPTDVDIRNIIVPPTTGRYSYASVAAKHDAILAAEASEPLGRAMCKRAGEQYNPETWQTFVGMYSQMNGTTPGMALDAGKADLAGLTALYKQHDKVWGHESQQEGQPTAPAVQGAPAPAAPAPQPPSADDFPKTAGGLVDAAAKAETLGAKALEGGALGGLVGGLSGVYEGDYSDLGGRALRGAGGGALGGAAGHMLGSHLNKYPWANHSADEAGHVIGSLLGSVGAAQPDLTNPNMSYAQGVSPDMYRYAADETCADLVKHAAAKSEEQPLRLVQYLAAAPNGVKLGFATILERNPRIFKYAAATYGAKALTDALRPAVTKTAMNYASAKTNEDLQVADGKSDFKSFGEQSGLAFRGVMLRGYYFKDSRKTRNLAVQEQGVERASDAQEPGVYKLFTMDGKKTPALILRAPIDLCCDDRNVYPLSGKGRVTPSRYAPDPRSYNREPEETQSVTHPDLDVERSHRVQRLVILGNGKSFLTEDVHGEQGTPGDLHGTDIYRKLFGGAAAKPAAGHGTFVYQIGAHFYGTCPVTLKDVTTGSDGVITATMEDGKQLRMDPRSPQGKLMRPKGEQFVIVPAHWKWLPLKEHEWRDAVIRDEKLMLAPRSIIEIGMNGLGSMGVHKAVVVDAGQDMASVDGGPSEPKAVALKKIAMTHDVSANDAEAMLKIAELEGHCNALIVPKHALAKHAHLVKKSSAVEQAFSETMQELSSQMENLQGQLSVLQSVQQRAQALSQDPAAMQQTDPSAQPQDPSQAPGAQAPQPAEPGNDPSQDPNAQPPVDPSQAAGAQAPQPAAPGGDLAQAPVDPSQQGMDPSQQGMDPSQQGMDPAQQGMPPQAPPLPMMLSEGPASSEVSQQLNPAFLNQAAAFDDAGTFDMSAIGDLERATGRAKGNTPQPVSAYAQDLGKTVDDLGRSLLMLQLRSHELQEQLSAPAFEELSEKVRNQFLGVGQLQLDLTRHSAALDYAQAPQNR